jgi:putative DNA primase/helicase
MIFFGLEDLSKQIYQQLDESNHPPQTAPEPNQTILPASTPENTPKEKTIYIHMLPDADGKRALATKKNLEFIIRHVGATVRYNVIAKKEEILIPGQTYSVDNYDNCCVSFFYDIAARLQMPTGQIVQFLSAIADANQYNPVATWIESKPWDGKSRLLDFCNTIEETETEYPGLKEKLIMKWMLSALAAAYQPNGVSAHGVLVFQGLQGLGKTQWFRKLVPSELKLTADGKTLMPNDKDSVLGVIKYWLVELGELDATFKKADIAQLKSFLPKDIDEVRAPYAAKASTFPRRTVFFASVNHEEFLADTTGNRRFWVIRCKSINWQHDLDMQQVWAELLVSYKAGQNWHLNAEELDMLNKSNSGSEVISTIEETIADFYNWNDEAGSRWIKSTKVLEEIGLKNPSMRDKNMAGLALKKLCKKPMKKIRGYNHFYVPKKKPDDQGDRLLWPSHLF